MAKAKRKNRKFYERILKARKADQSLADLARENGIPPRRLYSYRSDRARRQIQDPPEQADLISLSMPLSTSSMAFELVFDDFALHVPSDFDSEALRKLLLVLLQCF